MTSPHPIKVASFGSADRVAVTETPQEAGSVETLSLDSSLSRYVAVRAVDEQGNPGRPAVVDRGEAPRRR